MAGTLFAIGNGYLGLRADWAPDPQSAGSYVNGFHETFPIVYPETAHALAKTGQSILNAPDAKSMELAVAGEPLLLAAHHPDRAEISDFHREIDFRTGVLTSRFTWHPRGGGRVGVVSERLVEHDAAPPGGVAAVGHGARAAATGDIAVAARQPSGRRRAGDRSGP